MRDKTAHVPQVYMAASFVWIFYPGSVKLHQPSFGHLNAITAYGDGFIEVNKQRHDRSLVVLPEGPVLAWAPRHFDDISLDAVQALGAHTPQIILIGSGRKHRMAPGAALVWAHQTGIGLECQSTAAACRTFNILVSEGRRVCAALLLDL